MAIKHSKYRNTGILFELLVRQTTSDLISNKDSKSIRIIKKYFTNTELGKEYSLYNTLSTSKKLSEAKAEILISTLIEQYKKLDNAKLGKLKYNLIKEIKANYELEDFFKAKINNYKQYACLYTIFESQNTRTIDTKQLILNKISLLEHLTNESIIDKKAPESIMEEFMKEDEDVRLLAYKMLVEKFNSKYESLSEIQKSILTQYINSISDTKSLTKYLNERLNDVKRELNSLQKSTPDRILKIKLQEVLKLVQPIDENKSIKDETIVGILQCYDLIEEIKRANA
jgi:ribosomal protein L16 Arg81 hydroxylase